MIRDLWPTPQLFAGVCVCGLNSDQYFQHQQSTQGRQHFWRTDVCAYLTHSSDPSLMTLSKHIIIFNVNLPAKQVCGDVQQEQSMTSAGSTGGREEPVL